MGVLVGPGELLSLSSAYLAPETLHEQAAFVPTVKDGRRTPHLEADGHVTCRWWTLSWGAGTCGRGCVLFLIHGEDQKRLPFSPHKDRSSQVCVCVWADR